MENPIQKHIQNENDLDLYESYLKENFQGNPQTEVIEKAPESLSMPAEPYGKSVKCRKSTDGNAAISTVGLSDGYLRRQTGKLVKVDSLIGGRICAKAGILLDVGEDYIVIKPNKSCLSMMIPTANIEYITIIHDNDISKIFN